jgi:hypothetical protein
LLGANAVEPVVARYEVPTWIADDRYAQLSDFGKDILPKSVSIGKLRTRIVDSAINGATQMFDKGPEKVAVDWRDGSPRVDINPARRVRACLPE